MSVEVEIVLVGKVDLNKEALAPHRITMAYCDSLTKVLDRLKNPDGEGERIGIILVDIASGSEANTITSIKECRTRFGIPKIVGVSGLEPFEKQLRAAGCDEVWPQDHLAARLGPLLARIEG